MRYSRSSWLMVSALAGPLVNMAGAQATSPDSSLSAAASALKMAETLADKQHQVTLPVEVRRDEQPAPKLIEKQQPQPKREPQQAFVNPSSKPAAIQKRHRGPVRNLLASYKVRPPAPPQLTPAELAEREQVLVALRLVSAKLNVAQRKTQVLPAPNSIRNQHKIG